MDSNTSDTVSPADIFSFGEQPIFASDDQDIVSLNAISNIRQSHLASFDKSETASPAMVSSTRQPIPPPNFSFRDASPSAAVSYVQDPRLHTDDMSNTSGMSNTNTVSPIAVSTTQAPPPINLETVAENDCAACKKHYFVFPDSDDILCHDCMWFLQDSAPQTQEEADLEQLVRSFNDEQLKAVGLGQYFELENSSPVVSQQHKTSSAPQYTAVPTPQYRAVPTPQYKAPAPSMQTFRSPYDAQMSALVTQIMHERKKSNPNIFRTPDFAKPTTNTQKSALGSQIMHESHEKSTCISGTPDLTKPTTGTPAYSSQSQVMGMSSSAQTPSIGPGPITNDMIRSWLAEYQHDNRIPAAAAGHSCTSSTPFALPSVEHGGEMFESPSVQAQANKAKRRGKRMICATCQKDSPVSSKNDGVNCTRCFHKLQRSAVAVPLSPAVSQVKRAYEDAFEDALEGYSPMEASPIKRSKHFWEA